MVLLKANSKLPKEELNRGWVQDIKAREVNITMAARLRLQQSLEMSPSTESSMPLGLVRTGLSIGQRTSNAMRLLP